MFESLADSTNLPQDNSQNFHSSYILCIPGHIAEDERLQGDEKILFAQLSGLARSCGYCYASNECLASKIKISVNTLKIYLQHLEDLGYIKRDVQKIFDHRKKSIATQRRIYVACGFAPPVSKKVYDGQISDSKKVYEGNENGPSQKKIEKEDSHREKSDFSKKVYDGQKNGPYKEKEPFKIKAATPQPPLKQPTSNVPTSPAPAAASFKFSKNILNDMQKDFSAAAAFSDSDIAALRSELAQAIQDPEKVEVGITWYLSLPQNRREGIKNAVGSIISALRGSYAQERVKSLHDAKEREIEAFIEKEKKRQLENRRKIEEPIENQALFNESAKKLSSIDGIRTEGDTIYYDKADSVKNEHGIFQARMPNGRIYYSPTKCISCRFKFSISKKEFQAALNWFLDFFNPLLNPV